MRNSLPLIAAFGAANLVAQPALAENPKSPAEGFDIHVVAPHRHEDGTVHGPYHHYCKPIKPEVLQCMIFLSSDPNAELVEIEYFVDKKLARTNDLGAMEQALRRPGRPDPLRRHLDGGGLGAPAHVESAYVTCQFSVVLNGSI